MKMIDLRAIRRDPKSLSLPLINISLRGMNIVSRFGLVVLLANCLSMDDVGSFGLTAAVAAMLPAALGFGLNHFLAREIVGLDGLDAGRRARDRLLVSTISIGCAASLAFLLYFAHVPIPGLGPWLIVLCAFEVYALDLHLILIGAQRLVTANVAYFVRSSLWVAPLAALFYLDPASRTLHTVFGFWIVGLLLGFVIAGIGLREWPWRNIIVSRVRWDALRARMKEARLIYANDVGLVVLSYADRYVIAYFLGLSMTGIYTLYFSIANSVYTLVTAALIQTAMPRLVRSYREFGRNAFKGEVRRLILVVVSFGALCCVLLYVAYLFVISGILPTGKDGPIWLFQCMLAGALLKLLADVVGLSLYSVSLDNVLATLNIGFGIAAVALSCVLVSQYGLAGSGIVLITLPISFAITGWVALHKRLSLKLW